MGTRSGTMDARCPHCRANPPLEPLDSRYVAQLGGITCSYLFCSDCRTISREVRLIERYLGTALLIPMLGVSLGGMLAGSWLWIELVLHAAFPAGFVLASFALLNAGAFAIVMIVGRLRLLHSRERIVPIGELRMD